MRADKALVEYKMFPTRSKAQQAITNGIVFYMGQRLTKSGTEITDPTQLSIQGQKMPYVSRGGLKLEKALREFKIDLTDKIVLDIGSSTGGFTDCALQHGAKRIIAIDTGTNQMDEKLRQDSRISLFEQTDFRTLDLQYMISAEIAVIDISFLSVRKILEKLISLPYLQQVICLIKPQFECGKDIADKYKGVVLNQQIHSDILSNLSNVFKEKGLFINQLTFSPITGSSGNIEYLAYLTKNETVEPDIPFIVATAFNTFK